MVSPPIAWIRVFDFSETDSALPRKTKKTQKNTVPQNLVENPTSDENIRTSTNASIFAADAKEHCVVCSLIPAPANYDDLQCVPALILFCRTEYDWPYAKKNTRVNTSCPLEIN